MQRLRTKIFLTYCIILLIALLTFSVGFSFLLMDNLENSAKSNLGKTIEEALITINTIGTTPNPTQEESETVAHLIYEMIRFDPYTEIVLMDDNGQLLYEKDIYIYNEFFGANFLGTTDFYQLTKELNEIKAISYEGKKYLVYRQQLQSKAIPEVEYIGFAKSLQFIYSIGDTTINILALVLSVVTLAVLVAALIMSRKIAKPIKDLEEYAVAIGEGKVVGFQPDQGAFEIYSLGQHMLLMEEQLQLSKMQQKEYFSRVSHELRTPIAIIHGFGEGLNKGIVSDIENASSVVLKQSARLNTIVEQLLVMSKMDNDMIQYEMEEINISHFMENINESFEGVLPDHIKLMIQCSTSISVRSHEELLHQAITNPIRNSIRYAQSFISISIREDGDGYGVITISDDGGGLTEEGLQKVFDRFYKGPNGDIGLGMPIMKAAVETMDGSVELYNSDVGLVVKVKIPLA